MVKRSLIVAGLMEVRFRQFITSAGDALTLTKLCAAQNAVKPVPFDGKMGSSTPPPRRKKRRQEAYYSLPYISWKSARCGMFVRISATARDCGRPRSMRFA